MTDRNAIKVVCRLRPENAKELSGDYTRCVEFDREEISVQTKVESRSGTTSTTAQSTESHQFRFDRIFGPETEQIDVFNEVAKPVIDCVFEGYNGTIFAYGQTSSGKTFTMEGIIHDPAKKGITPRMMENVFGKIKEAPGNLEFLIKCSMLEIYMERIQDLLNPRKTNLQVKGGSIQDATEEYVSSQAEMEELMRIGAQNRQIAATGMNEKSSRSHSLFIMTITKKDRKDESSKTGRLYLIDLAGSEKVGKTNCAGQQLEEAKTINKSLSALGNVINALTEKKKGGHIPYRDSKLTHILQDSIGGNSLTALIITCSMSSFNAPETLSTLRFGSRAKKIQNKPTVNSERSAKKLMKLLSEAEEKIKRQNDVIHHLHKKISGVLTEAQHTGLRNEFLELVKKVDADDAAMNEGKG